MIAQGEVWPRDNDGTRGSVYRGSQRDTNVSAARTQRKTKMVTQKKGKGFFYSLRRKRGGRKKAQSACNLGSECSRKKGQLQILYQLSCYFSHKTKFLSDTV